MEKKLNPVEMMCIKVTVARRTVQNIDALAAGRGSNRQGELARLITAFGDGDIKDGYTLVPYDHGNAKNGRRL